jgi:hypothetical protein
VKAMALVPFGYSLITRFNTARDFLYLVATQWIPGIWLVHRLGAVDLAAAAALYAAGYLAFIALYEIGYLVNDTWDASATAGRIGDLDWLALCAVLMVAFALHNLLTQNYFRIASFTQLVFIRFSTPILFGVDSENILLFTCTIFYFMFRFLPYIEEKGFFLMNERRLANFGVVQTSIYFPLIFIICVSIENLYFFEIFLYFVSVYGLYYFISERRPH